MYRSRFFFDRLFPKPISEPNGADKIDQISRINIDENRLKSPKKLSKIRAATMPPVASLIRGVDSREYDGKSYETLISFDDVDDDDGDGDDENDNDDNEDGEQNLRRKKIINDNNIRRNLRRTPSNRKRNIPRWRIIDDPALQASASTADDGKKATKSEQKVSIVKNKEEEEEEEEVEEEKEEEIFSRKVKNKIKSLIESEAIAQKNRDSGIELIKKSKPRRIVAAPSVSLPIESTNLSSSALSLSSFEQLIFRGIRYRVGDIVGLLDKEDKSQIYYAQIRGFMRDQYATPSAVLTWLLPSAAAPAVEFDPATYYLGPEEDVPRRLESLRWICRAPSEYYLDRRAAPYPTYASLRNRKGYVCRQNRAPAKSVSAQLGVLGPRIGVTLDSDESHRLAYEPEFFDDDANPDNNNNANDYDDNERIDDEAKQDDKQNAHNIIIDRPITEEENQWIQIAMTYEPPQELFDSCQLTRSANKNDENGEKQKDFLKPPTTTSVRADKESLS